ncbi:acetyl-CoA decarbonylase/synthase complex subunit gamma, partial [Candidatus Margulisiibacteriota bacterium]
MVLTGLDIYKKLPKTNCKKCSFPTCLAFAMALAQKKAALDKCPDVSEEAKQALDAASLPPIATITIGVGDKKVTIGGETVMFRHEKRFYNQTGLALQVKDTLSSDDLQKRIKEINELVFERVGMTVGVDLIAIVNESKDKTKFLDALKMVTELSLLPIILVSEDVETLKAALELCKDRKPLIYALDEKNKDAFLDLAKTSACPLAIKGKNLEEAANFAQAATSGGVKELVVDAGADVQNLTQMRRLALKKNYRPLGFPN